MAAVRQDMLAEAIQIIRALHTGELTTWVGEYFRVDSARVWDLPDTGVPLAIAVSGDRSIAEFAPLADHMISDRTRCGAGRRLGPDPGRRGTAGQPQDRPGSDLLGPGQGPGVARAHELFRWFGGGWSVNADLPTPAGFEGASQFVRPEDVADSIACGPDLDELAESLRPYWEAGYTDVALVQIGDESQQEFLDKVAEPLLEKLRAAAGS